VKDGCSFHRPAAGLVATADIFDAASCAIYKHGRDLFDTLEEETGLATGFKQVGYVQVVNNVERLHHMRRVSAFQALHGIENNEISVDQMRDMYLLANYDDAIAGFFAPKDGRVNPVDVTMAIAKSARMGGARIFEGQQVTEILVANGSACGVQLATGDTIKVENVVICGGLWSRELGARAGVNLPLQAAEHYYLITEEIEGMSRDAPVLEDPTTYAYYREETGGMMIGLFEPDDSAAWNLHETPHDFSLGEIMPDWDRMLPHLERAYSRVPQAIDAGVRRFFCGPESFTPDLAPLVGETPELRNLWVACGLNSTGILNGPGTGMVLANWIVNGEAPVDVTAINVNRFSREANTPTFRQHRTKELLGKMFGVKYPFKGPQTARGGKRSVLYDRLASAGAHFSDDHGFEVVDWFAPEGHDPVVEKHSWWRENWWHYLEEEVRAARRDIVLMDMSDMAKFQIEGLDACKLISRISTNHVDVEIGRIVYTCWVNQAGGMEADLTVTRLADNKFMVVTAEAWRGHTEMILRRALGDREFAVITNVTAAIAQINAHGPKARQLLETLTSADMSNAAFPFGTAKTIDIGYAEVLALRVTYIGELGWELQIPSTGACHVYDLVVEVGQNFGLRHAGLQALFALRMEKGYREFGHDMDNTDTPYEAGLGFTVKLDKPGGFIGRDALAKEKADGPPKRRLLQFLLNDPEPLLYGGEPILVDGQPVGYISSAGYGFNLGSAMGLGYVELAEPLSQALAEQTDFMIDVAGAHFSAKASLRPMVDPKLERVKC